MAGYGTMPARAGELIVDALIIENGQTIHELDAILRKQHLDGYVRAGVRWIRDNLGADALVVRTNGLRWEYVLDPEREDGMAWSLTMARRGKTEGEHVVQVLDWLAKTHGNTKIIREARRYANNLVAELESLVDSLS